MPTQPTNLTSEAECDAAVLGLDLSITLAKEAMSGTLAASRSDVPMVAPDDALSEQDAAGVTAVSIRLLSSLKRYWRGFRDWRQCQRLRANLHDLSDRDLMDIGVTRSEIDYIVAHRAIDRLRDSTMYLWIQSRGVM